MIGGALLDGRSAGNDEPSRLDVLSDAGLVEEFLEVRRRVARLEARSAALLGKIEQRGIPAVEGFGSATGWLNGPDRGSGAVFPSRVAVTQALRHMPLTRRAFAAGESSECRVRLLAATWETAPGLFAPRSR